MYLQQLQRNFAFFQRFFEKNRNYNVLQNVNLFQDEAETRVTKSYVRVFTVFSKINGLIWPVPLYHKNCVSWLLFY